MMTQQAQAALRRVIEQYTKNVRFCIICNYVNKITPAIQSRCTRFRFSPLPISEVEKRLVTVVDAETWLHFSSHPKTISLTISFQSQFNWWREKGTPQAFQGGYATRSQCPASMPCSVWRYWRNWDIQLYWKSPSIRYWNDRKLNVFEWVHNSVPK